MSRKKTFTKKSLSSLRLHRPTVKALTRDGRLKLVADLVKLSTTEFRQFDGLENGQKATIAHKLLENDLAFVDGKNATQQLIDELGGYRGRAYSGKKKVAKKRRQQTSKPAKIKARAGAEGPKKTSTEVTSLVVRKAVGANLEPPALRDKGIPFLISAAVEAALGDGSDDEPERVEEISVTTNRHRFDLKITRRLPQPAAASTP